MGAVRRRADGSYISQEGAFIGKPVPKKQADRAKTPEYKAAQTKPHRVNPDCEHTISKGTGKRDFLRHLKTYACCRGFAMDLVAGNAEVAASPGGFTTTGAKRWLEKVDLEKLPVAKRAKKEK